MRGIGGASLLADVGHEIPTSLLPSLLTGKLGAPAAALGIIEGVADGIAGAARDSRAGAGHRPRGDRPRSCLHPRRIGIGCVETAEHAVVAALARERLRGSAFGLLAGAQSLGNFVASCVAGLLWTLVSLTAAFVYAAVWMLIALAALTGTHQDAARPS